MNVTNTTKASATESSEPHFISNRTTQVTSIGTTINMTTTSAIATNHTLTSPAIVENSTTSLPPQNTSVTTSKPSTTSELVSSRSIDPTTPAIFSTRWRNATTSSVNNKSISTSTRVSSSGSTTSFSTVSDKIIKDSTCSVNCVSLIGIISGISVAVIFLVILISLACFIRQRKKWQSRLKAEQRQTDLWTTQSYNNTIVNDNFLDYKLASPNPASYSGEPYNRKSSRKSDQSVEMNEHLDPSSYPDQFVFDSGTMRRNTYSVPDNLTKLDNEHAQKISQSGDHARTLDIRGRSSTFTTGKHPKRNVDQHVLLSHEEIFDERLDANIMRNPRHKSIITEL